jgi:hypothetical protein
MQLRTAGFRLDAADNRLLVAPASRLSDAHRADVHAHVLELLQLIDAEYAREAFEERAGIMEFDGGMTRSDAEAAARILIANARRKHADD